MRRFGKRFQVFAVNIGTCAVGETHTGVPVDTMGFTDVLAILVAGKVTGTSTNTGTLTVKMQESASVTGTGSAWADITDGAVSAGSYKFADVALIHGTTKLYQEALPERLGIDRKRWIRCHATVAGTDSINVSYSVAVLLGGAYDSDLIASAGAVRATANSEVS